LRRLLRVQQRIRPRCSCCLKAIRVIAFKPFTIVLISSTLAQAGIIIIHIIPDELVHVLEGAVVFAAVLIR